MEKIGQRVVRLRKERKISQNQLACLIGCGISTLQRLEAHEHLKISLDSAIRMAEVLNVSLDYLYTGIEVKRVEVKLPDAPRKWFEV